MISLQTRSANAALATLFILQIILLTTLFVGIAPHPPAVFPISGMAPFIAVSLSTLLAAYMVGPLENAAGRGLSICAIVLALVSFGPQKYFDAQWSVIWPAVLWAQLACVTLGILVIRSTKASDNQTAPLDLAEEGVSA